MQLGEGHNTSRITPLKGEPLEARKTTSLEMCPTVSLLGRCSVLLHSRTYALPA